MASCPLSDTEFKGSTKHTKAEIIATKTGYIKGMEPMPRVEWHELELTLVDNPQSEPI